ncbi:hypothetical protein LTR94_024292 [Friedmanniomyces endolithicus]|nr:hypothetical protein LTR94_024292 [Friedmanniomyces endolithicus]
MTFETEQPGRVDKRPGIAICAFDEGEQGWDLVEDLSGEHWSPPGARTVSVPSGEPDALAAALCGHLSSGECRAVLLVGRTHRSSGFQMQMRAENLSLDRKARVSDIGPALARSTAPVAEIVRALNDAGLSALASSDAEEDAGSYILYRVLTGLPDGP